MVVTWDKYYCPACHGTPLKIENFRSGYDFDRKEPFLGICNRCGKMIWASDLDQQDDDEDECC